MFATIIFFSFSIIVLLALLIYVVICGQNRYHRDGRIGRIYRFISQQIPAFIEKTINRYFPNCNIDASPDIANTVFKYITMLFYSGIYSFFALTFLIKSYNCIDKVFSHPFLAYSAAILILPWPWIILISLHHMDPGIITKENFKEYMDLYPFDGVLYKERYSDKEGFPIVARSHFCTFWNVRVAKYDHYCAWVAAPIGAKNHKYFLAFLVTNINSAILYIYVTYKLLCYKLSVHNVIIENFKSIYDNFFWVLFWEPLIFASLASLIVTLIALTLFVLQESIGISRNITLVEGEKISKVKSELKKQNIKYTHSYDKGFIQNWKEFLNL